MKTPFYFLSIIVTACLIWLQLPDGPRPVSKYKTEEKKPTRTRKAVNTKDLIPSHILTDETGHLFDFPTVQVIQKKDGGLIYFGGQLSPLKQKKFLISHNIDKVLRANGNSAKDNGGVSIDREEAITAAASIKLKKDIDFTRFDAHAGHKQNYGYLGSLDFVFNQFDSNENIYIHCLHGRHRSIYPVAAYLKKVKGLEEEEIIRLLNWEAIVADETYKKYVLTAFGG